MCQAFCFIAQLLHKLISFATKKNPNTALHVNQDSGSTLDGDLESSFKDYDDNDCWASESRYSLLYTLFGFVYYWSAVRAAKRLWPGYIEKREDSIWLCKSDGTSTILSPATCIFDYKS